MIMLRVCDVTDCVDRQLMSENVDAVEHDGACKHAKLSLFDDLSVNAVIDSTSDLVSSTSSLLADDTGSYVCMCVWNVHHVITFCCRCFVL